MAQHFQIEESKVRVIGMEMGGGFGTKSYYPVALEAAKLALQAGRPVRIAYTRADEMVWGNFRPAALIEIKSGFRKDGTIVGWEFNAYHAGPSANIGRRGSDGPYDIPHVKVTVSTSDSPIRTGSYRSLGAAVNHFARESHMDEIAAAVGMDPVALRFKNLTHPRFRGVLEAATQRFGWSPGAAPSHRGVGAALCFDVGSYGAACFELDIAGREVNLKRVVFAADCGQVVNPVGVENQVEGAIMMGVGTALYESVEFRDGRLLTSSFARYRVPRIVNLPAIEVVIVGDQTLPSTGAGELGIVPVTAAIANAVYDLTGQRVRELPVQPHLA
jgi:isoquinoline 1-oxidoreductase